MNIFSKFVLALALVFSPVSEAMLFDHGEFTTDDVSGLDWLDAGTELTEVDIIDRWRYATSEEFAMLLQNSDDSGMFYPASSTGNSLWLPWYKYDLTIYPITTDPPDIDEPSIDKLIEFFTDGEAYLSAFVYEDTPAQPPGLEIGRDVFAGLTTSYAGDPLMVAGIYRGSDHLPALDFHITGDNQNTSYLKVRDAAIPEPGIITLIGIGIVGLGFVRRRMRQM